MCCNALDRIIRQQVFASAPNQEPTLDLHSRAAPIVEVHHLVSCQRYKQEEIPEEGGKSRDPWVTHFEEK